MVYGMDTKRLLLACLALIPALALAIAPTVSTDPGPTIALSEPVSVSAGGTGASSLATNGVLIGEGTAAVNSVTLGADTLLQGQETGVDPAAATVPDCAASGDALNYSTTTHAFSCQTIPRAGGTMAAVASDEARSTGGSGFVWGAATTGNSVTLRQGSWCRLTAS